MKQWRLRIGKQMSRHIYAGPKGPKKHGNEVKIQRFNINDKKERIFFGATCLMSSGLVDLQEKMVEAAIMLDTARFEHSSVFVAKTGPGNLSPVAMVIAVLGMDESDKIGISVLHLYVLPEFRNKGLGTRLIKTAIGRHPASATVKPEAIKTFRHAGFTVGEKCPDGCFDMHKPKNFYVSKFPIGSRFF